MKVGRKPRVAIIGGGLAGMAAAWRLARRGAEVTVLERKSVSGGRAGSAADPATGEPVDTGHHMMMGCYTHTLAWFREMGTIPLVGFQQRLAVAYADENGGRFSFRAGRLPAPFHLLAGLWALSGMSLAERVRALRLVPASFGGHALDAITVSEWMNALLLPEPVRRLVIRPLALAGLNESPETASALPLVRILRRLARHGGRWSGLAWARAGLAELYLEPVRREVERAGGSVRTGAWATGLEVAGGRAAGVRLATGAPVEADEVVAAVPPWDLVTLLAEAPGCEDLAGNAARLSPSPILTVHLWFDRPVLDTPVLGLLGGVFDWAFDRTALTGPAGRGIQQVCLVRSGARELLKKSPDGLVALARADLAKRFVGADGATVVHHRLVWETRGTVSLVPGTEALRPGPATPLPGFFLAGDWTATGLPATIEGAVVSGERAAKECMRSLK